MSQFLGWILFLVVIGSFLLHAEVELPSYLSWVGTLPGDMIIKKKGVTIYFPLASSAVISAALSFLFSLFGRK